MKKVFLFSVLSLFTLLVFADGNIVSTARVTFTSAPIGAINGNAVFSVASGKQVYFSMGNLQWQGSTKTWRFAEHQYDYIGNANNNTSLSSSSSSYMDLFGWATSGFHDGEDSDNKYYYPYSYNSSSINTSTNYYGFGPSTNRANSNISNSNYDWGVWNKISNGGNEQGQWRTLTKAEWDYLLGTRTNAANLRALATVCSKKGLLIFPDGWQQVSGVTVYITTADYTTNTFDATAWAALEASGALFLPAAGYRSNVTVNNPNSYGYYWTSTKSLNTGKDAYAVYFYSGSAPANTTQARYYGCSVRLVQNKPN